MWVFVGFFFFSFLIFYHEQKWLCAHETVSNKLSLFLESSRLLETLPNTVFHSGNLMSKGSRFKGWGIYFVLLWTAVEASDIFRDWDLIIILTKIHASQNFREYNTGIISDTFLISLISETFHITHVKGFKLHPKFQWNISWVTGQGLPFVVMVGSW